MNFCKICFLAFRRYSLCFAIMFLLSSQSAAQNVTFSFEELELDGSNVLTDGKQVVGHCVSGVNGGFPVQPAAGVDWLLNFGSVDIDAPGSILSRNLPSGVASAGTPAEGIFFGFEDFETDVVPTGDTPYDLYFAPSIGTIGVLPEDQSDLHLVMQGILFGASYSITINDLTDGTDYRIQIISWDAGVESEGFGSPGIDQKEFRRSEISSGDSSMEYNQFVVDGVDAGTIIGNSSEEITAALVTAEFTTGLKQTASHSISPFRDCSQKVTMKMTTEFTTRWSFTS